MPCSPKPHETWMVGRLPSPGCHPRLATARDASPAQGARPCGARPSSPVCPQAVLVQHEMLPPGRELRAASRPYTTPIPPQKISPTAPMPQTPPALPCLRAARRQVGIRIFAVRLSKPLHDKALLENAARGRQPDHCCSGAQCRDASLHNECSAQPEAPTRRIMPSPLHGGCCCCCFCPPPNSRPRRPVAGTPLCLGPPCCWAASLDTSSPSAAS